jgi:VWFA-related protein
LERRIILKKLFSRFVCGLFVVAALAAVPTRAQTPDDVIRINTELVVVDAQVINKKTGRLIGSLKREDFQLYEDGVKQELTFFSQDKLPLSIVLLFDLTDTVRPVLKPLARGALAALEHLKPEDEVAVMTYAASAQVIQGFTTDRRLIVAAIEKASAMDSNEAAFFNEGVFQASTLSTKATIPNSRRAVIWLTDNQPNIPSEGTRRKDGASGPAGELHTEKDALNQVLESETMVAAIIERSALSVMANVLFTKNPMFALSRKHHPPGDVYKYAEQTGGEVMRASTEEVSTKLAELIDHIRARYSFGYRPSVEQPFGKFCSLKLTVTPGVQKREGKVAVRTSAGYYRGARHKDKTPAPERPTLKPE